MHSEAVDFLLDLDELKAITRERGISYEAFEKTITIRFEDNIEKHAQWAYENIFRIPYSSGERVHHGIHHTALVSIFSVVAVNFLRRYGYKDAEAVTPKQMKLIQIGAIFHDAGRLDDEVDRWDHQSAVLLYAYLTLVLDVPKFEAQKLYEAVAFKDKILGDGSDSIEKIAINAGDCLAIMRVAYSFDAPKYFILYKLLAHLSPLAFNEIAWLITEARSVMAIQGDHCRVEKRGCPSTL